MKCLVTGAAGYIGNKLVKRLVDEGHDVSALIHKHKPRNPVIKAKYINGDITDIDSIKPYLKEMDIVFHCAAYVKDHGPKKLFYKINYIATKNLADACEENNVKKFIFLSHIHYDKEEKTSYYTKTKALAEDYLLEKHKKNKFSVIIIRPGNVYGPGHAIWVIYPIRSIQKNRISLIDNGKGIFIHTYIDNLIDAIILTLQTDKAIGQRFDITDGEYNTTWAEYLNHLARLIGKPEIKRNMSKKTAMFIAKSMMLLHKLFRIKPWITPMSVNIFTNDLKVSISKAESILGYKPKVNYENGMKKVEEWLNKNEDIS